ncbi:flagellar biosynthetic protein FliQ [Chitinasiproducens palmae]|uniref:Flagellar biosynthetic protein FliQ n=1 Tax=Chitinasiproducens palmae TaxID=1770053 RepID=A0A1H2PKP4_9BURK|nr:flagellar biosynthetic protein FliQ [Chitinasiproducens palmae]SDV46926.1 flagellar biosynthetic protein FliQ [Chitinasiproducens palmae]
MSPDLIVEMIGGALRFAAMLVTALILPSLLVGLAVSVFQALTSINEQTLSFLPRLLVTLLTVIVGAHWLARSMMEYCVEVFTRATVLIQ